MATLTDGLGFEELGDASDTGSKVSQIFITGSITTDSQVSGLNVYATGSVVSERILGTNVIGTADISGLDVYGQGSGTFGRVTNADGALLPISAGSPSVYGQTMQAGSTTTNAAGVGSVIFGRAFTDGNYRIFLQPGSTAAAAGVQGVLGSMQPVISGLKLDSGLAYYGGETQPYDYIAVGLL